MTVNSKAGVLVITELFLPTKGGTAVWFDEVYRRLGGKEIHVITAEVAGGADHDATHPNTIHRVSLRRRWWLRPESLAMYLRLFFSALQLASSKRFYAVHAGRVLPEGLIAWLIGRLFGKQVVIYAHGEEITTWRTPVKSRLMKFLYRNADTVIANSEFTSSLLEGLGVPPQKVKLVHPGVDISRFRRGLDTDGLRSQFGVPATASLLVSVGRLSRRKGFDQVIRALPALVESGVDVHYAVVGIGEDEEYLKKLALEHGVDLRLHLLGHVPAADLPLWYNEAALFVMPNRNVDGDTEGFGMVYIEAAACGKTSVAGCDGGTGSAVIDGVTGIRVDGSDLDKVKQALIELLGDRILLDRLAESAYQRVQDELSWEMVADKTVHALTKSGKGNTV